MRRKQKIIRVDELLLKEIEKIRKEYEVDYPTATRLLAKQIMKLKMKKSKKDEEDILDVFEGWI